MNFELSPKSMEMTCTWDDAVIYCSNLGDGWRLPTLQELQEIITLSENYRNDKPSVAPNVPYHDFDYKWHWTTDEYEYKIYWSYNFWSLTSLPAPNTINWFCVRPVRDIK